MSYEIDLALPDRPTADGVVSVGEHAEELGYDRVWVPENWGRDQVSLLATLGERTERIGLGTGITPVYSRTPSLVGQTAATLQELTDGRFRVGLGPSGPAVIENWHGVDFERPLRRTREYVEIVRQVVNGEEVNYDGDFFSASGFRYRADPPETPPGIDASGLGPKAVELAGRFADGWHAFLFSPSGLRGRLEDFRRGADLGNRDPAEARVAATVPVCALEDGERARELASQHVAFYVGAMGTFYRDSVARQGHEETAEAIFEAWQDGEQGQAIATARDELLDEYAAAGTPEEVRNQLDAFAVDGVDALTVYVPTRADNDEMEETLAAVGPNG